MVDVHIARQVRLTASEVEAHAPLREDPHAIARNHRGRGRDPEMRNRSARFIATSRAPHETAGAFDAIALLDVTALVPLTATTMEASGAAPESD